MPDDRCAFDCQDFGDGLLHRGGYDGRLGLDVELELVEDDARADSEVGLDFAARRISRPWPISNPTATFSIGSGPGIFTTMLPMKTPRLDS